VYQTRQVAAAAARRSGNYKVSAGLTEQFGLASRFTHRRRISEASRTSKTTAHVQTQRMDFSIQLL